MANDDEFAALMDGIGVKPLTADLKQRETARRPSLNTAAEGQLTGPRRSAAADRAQPSVTARHAAAAAAHERHDAVATQLLTEQGKLAVAERAVGDPDRYVDRAVGTQRALCGLVGACYGRTLLGDDDAEPGPGRDGDVEDGDLAA